MKIRLRNDRNYNSKGKVQCTESCAMIPEHALLVKDEKDK